jgi:hypothetical protein
MRIAASPRAVTGELRFVRDDRAFEEDEIALIEELVSKAELSAAEIIAHETIRQQASDGTPFPEPLGWVASSRRRSRASAPRIALAATSSAPTSTSMARTPTPSSTGPPRH